MIKNIHKSLFYALVVVRFGRKVLREAEKLRNYVQHLHQDLKVEIIFDFSRSHTALQLADDVLHLFLVQFVEEIDGRFGHLRYCVRDEQVSVAVFAVVVHVGVEKSFDKVVETDVFEFFSDLVVHFIGAVFHRFEEEILFVLEIAVKRSFADTGTFRDVVDIGDVKTESSKTYGSSLKDF